MCFNSLLINDFNKSLFSVVEDGPNWFQTNICFLGIDEESLLELGSPNGDLEVRDVVFSIYTSLSASVSYTVIVLTPNIYCSEFVDQFRPISICNTLNNIVSKVVVSRLKKIIPKLSPFFKLNSFNQPSLQLEGIWGVTKLEVNGIR